MRPISLTLQGFRSYRERTHIDLEGRDLVAIVGPTGAGKSTVLDAVAFALYGKTPRVERDTKSLINQLADIAQVELVFEAAGERWRVTRAIKRKGASGNKLERVLPDGTEEVEGALEREVNARVEELLGLDFKAFCRSVLLAQNQFAEFLTATPAKRDEVLKGVFGYDQIDRMREAARRDLAAVQANLEDIDRQRADMAAAKQSQAEAKSIRKDMAAALKAMQSLQPRVNRHQAERDAAERAGAEATRELEALEAVLGSLPDPDEVAALSKAVAGANAEVDAARDASDGALEALRSAEQALAAAEAAGGGTAALDEGARLLATLQAQDAALAEAEARNAAATAASAEAQGALVAAESSLAEAEAAATSAAAAAQAAEEELQARDRDLDDARHAEMAASVRAKLVAGGTCPVCEQPVHDLPPRRRAPDTDKAARAKEKAAGALSKATAAREKAAAAAEGARTELKAKTADAKRREAESERAAADLVSRRVSLEALRAEIEATLGAGDPERILADRRAAMEAARTEVRSRSADAEQARTRLEEARAQAEASRSRLRDAALSLASSAGRLGIEAISDDDPVAVAKAAKTVRAAADRSLAKARAAAVKADAALAKADEALAALLRQVGLSPDDDFSSALVDARAALAEADARTTVLQERIAAAASVDAREREALARRDLLTRLSSDLTPARFLNHLLAGERAALADLGSDHFEKLSDGRYRFTDDGNFDVSDRNAADARRRPDSLSGGETFLASLALALALAEMVARGGGRLDAFFIDEGFGSLDPEHLDRAMEGVERLIAEAPHRLVVLVSHVAAIRERVDDLIILDGAPVTGETVVVSGASR